MPMLDKSRAVRRACHAQASDVQQHRANKFRRCIERLRIMVDQRSNTLLPETRDLLLMWAEELEAELNAEQGG